MESARVLGNNITLLLNVNNISKEHFANEVRYSYYDVLKLCDGRLLTTSEDIKDIAKYFDVSTEELLTYKGENAYKGNGFLHCVGEFKNIKNKNKILDIFDMYCNIQEALA